MEGSLTSRISESVRDMQEGLQPEELSGWYDVIRDRAREICPEELREKISIQQDGILPMKFKLSLSKRVIHFVVSAIDQTLPEMPYSTMLYFGKVREIILGELARSSPNEPSATAQ